MKDKFRPIWGHFGRNLEMTGRFSKIVLQKRNAAMNAAFGVFGDYLKLNSYVSFKGAFTLSSNFFKSSLRMT